MKPSRAALYARVSTTDQNPEAQLHPLSEFAHARGFVVVSEHIDHGVSGSKSSRPALDEMMTAARKREVDVIVIAKLDRLARSVQHLVAIAAELESLNVDLVVRDQAIGTSTSTGKLTFHVLAALAEFERDLIRERTHPSSPPEVHPIYRGSARHLCRIPSAIPPEIRPPPTRQATPSSVHLSTDRAS